MSENAYRRDERKSRSNIIIIIIINKLRGPRGSQKSSDLLYPNLPGQVSSELARTRGARREGEKEKGVMDPRTVCPDLGRG